MEGRVLVSERRFEGDEFSIGGRRRVDVWTAMLRGVQASPLLGSVGADEARRSMLSLTNSGRKIIEEAGETGNVTVSSDALWLLKELSEPISLSRLRTRAGVGENIRGLIWLLESLALLESYIEPEVAENTAQLSESSKSVSEEGPLVVDDPVTTEPPPIITSTHTKVESPRPPPQQPQDLGDRPSDPIEGLRWEYNARMGFDYYGFLGMEESSSSIDLVVECRKVMQRLHGAQRSNALPDDVQQMVSELLSALTLVFSTFSDQRRKELYDAALASGEAQPLAKSDVYLAQNTEDSITSKERARNFTPPEQDVEGWSFWKKGKN
jgi:hypothetical protein